jgi:hypothetical protein
MKQLPKDQENEKRYRKLESRLYLVHMDRNLIAHYNTSLIKGVDASLGNVRWLQEAMGLVKTE